ncbi:MAG: hypothetical protein WBV94_28860 [Blastocatellia bacterium]
MKFKVMAILVFLCGTTLFTAKLIRSERAEAQEAANTIKSFIVQYVVSDSEDTNPPVPQEYRIRAVNSTGEWKETRYSFDGKVSTLGASGEGVYIITGKARQYYGKNAPDMIRNTWRSEEDLTGDQQFIRTENLAGVKTFVLKQDLGNMESETNYALETGLTPLKTVIRAKPETGKKLLNVTEAVNIEFRELSDKEVQLPDLPVRFDLVEEKIQSLLAAGHKSQADMLQQAINKLKTGAK